MPIRPTSERTERAGVLAVGEIFNNRLGWIFREQPVSDFGIDAHVEVVEGDQVTGRLFALQIKSGPSYFRRRGSEYVFAGDIDHLRYWAGHDLPVFLILHDPETDRTVWQLINLDTAEIDGDRWKVTIPATNVLDETAKPFLNLGIARGEANARRFRFAVDRNLMERFHDRTAFVEIDIWVNKSLSVRELKIIFDDPYNDPEIFIDVMVTWHYELTEIMEHFFPWLEYDYARETEEVAGGEIESHCFGVWLTPIAEKYLEVEKYFHNGDAE